MLVLQGSRQLVTECRPWIIVEMHHQSELPMIENARQLLGWCQDVKYQAYYLKEHEPLVTTDQIAHRGRCHVLLLPSNDEYPEWLKEIPQGAPIQFV